MQSSGDAVHITLFTQKHNPGPTVFTFHINAQPRARNHASQVNKQKAVALQVLQVHCARFTDLVIEKEIRQMALCAGL